MYLIERLLTKDPESYYNDLAQWHYHKLPEALGCDGWFTARVTTCGELDEAIKTAEARGTGAYIEVVTDKYAASPLARKYHESIETLYAARPPQRTGPSTQRSMGRRLSETEGGQ